MERRADREILRSPWRPRKTASGSERRGGSSQSPSFDPSAVELQLSGFGQQSPMSQRRDMGHPGFCFRVGAGPSTHRVGMPILFQGDDVCSLPPFAEGREGWGTLIFVVRAGTGGLSSSVGMTKLFFHARCRRCELEALVRFLSGAKRRWMGYFVARLKPCPDTELSDDKTFFQSPLKPQGS